MAGRPEATTLAYTLKVIASLSEVILEYCVIILMLENFVIILITFSPEKRNYCDKIMNFKLFGIIMVTNN